MRVEPRQNFQFLREIIWFLGNHRALPKLRYRIFHYVISIINLRKNQSINANFLLTTRATLIHTDLKSGP